MSLDYDSVPATGEYEATKEISNQVEEVTDVAHLGPWELHRNDDGTVVYTFNNTEDDGRPPLLLYIRDDDVVKLNTTAYGEKTITGGQCKLARKATKPDDSAIEWVEEHFTLER